MRRCIVAGNGQIPSSSTHHAERNLKSVHKYRRFSNLYSLSSVATPTCDPRSMMDASEYKKHTTSRGFSYSYYASPAQGDKPTLLFVHGFPSSSWDWHNQVAFFKPKGFGLIVPDMLGYAGTAKPTDPASYVGSGLAQDVADILDHEGLQQVVAIGHDWGCRIVSRLVNLHPERVLAAAFLAVGYVPPNPVHDPVAATAYCRRTFGRDLWGYWIPFSEEGGATTIEKNIDSFLALVFPATPELWIDHLGAIGGTKTWLESNKQGPAPAYLTSEVIHLSDGNHPLLTTIRKLLLDGGMTGPLSYYKVNTLGLNAEDDKLVPREKYDLHLPVFFGATTRDYVCTPAFDLLPLGRHAQGPLTVREFDADHWITLSHSPQVNAALLEWIGGLSLGA
ncbi:hypothetical protein EVG20_g5975 [Dentipellis fragilis]|uniref:AB hydrolase-1 domain-containing protein n=1 Tax=Dentipellis fragilis TaxID=205917 RepID=A0A4Y9YRK0_9AGAM|nr:hypothetical protein EVG20_g5975 [Dentipellis fragilis]